MAKLKAKSLFDLTFVSDAQLSPDGKQVVAVQTTIVQPGEEKPPAYRSHLFLYDAATPGGGTQLTWSGDANTQPRFSSDGAQVAFTSRRGEKAKAQLYLLPLGGGEARALTELKAGVGEFVWSPSGRNLAFTSGGDFEDRGAERGAARTIDRLFYKADGVGFRLDEPEQVYLLTSRRGAQSSSLNSNAAPRAWRSARTGAFSTTSPPPARTPRTGGKACSGGCRQGARANPSGSPRT